MQSPEPLSLKPRDPCSGLSRNCLPSPHTVEVREPTRRIFPGGSDRGQTRTELHPAESLLEDHWQAAEKPREKHLHAMDGQGHGTGLFRQQSQGVLLGLPEDKKHSFQGDLRHSQAIHCEVNQ